MDETLASADDYLQHVNQALDDANREIEVAATTFVGTREGQQRLGAALGKAQHAVTRAQRDLRAHLERRSLHEDRSTADEYFTSILRKDGRAAEQLVVAILPLPFEEERVPLERVEERAFHNDFTLWVTRFNNAERRSKSPYLMEVPGGLTPSVENGHFRFIAIPQGGNEETQIGDLYSTGTFVFRHRLFSHTSPPTYTVGWVDDLVGATLRFVWRLYEDIHLAPRAIAVQSMLQNIESHGLVVPGRLFSTAAAAPREVISNLVAPQQPVVLSFPPDDKAIERMMSRITGAIRSHYEKPA